MGYMIEGGGSKTMSKAKSWINEHSSATQELLALLTDVIVEYLEMQVRAGAQLLQVFESSAEHLTKQEFLQVALPYLRDIRTKLLANLKAKNIPAVPMVLPPLCALHTHNVRMLIVLVGDSSRSCLRRVRAAH